MRDALLLLPELYGGAEVLALARKRLPAIPALRSALDTLRALAKACPIPASFDLAELRGYHYPRYGSLMKLSAARIRLFSTTPPTLACC